MDSIGNLGAENVDPYGFGSDLTIDTNDNLYYVFIPINDITSFSARRIFAKTGSVGVPSAAWTALDGSPGQTLVTNDFSPSLYTIGTAIDTATDYLHIVWLSDALKKIRHTAWNPIAKQFETMSGSLGQETVNGLTKSGRINLLSTLRFNPAQGGAPRILVDLFGFPPNTFQYIEWDKDNQSWQTHINNSVPEEIQTEINARVTHGFDIDNNGDPYIIYGDVEIHPAATINNLKITTFTPEAVDVTRNTLQSKDIDQTDESIVKAKISWQGESRGYAGSTQATVAQSFSASSGRNAFVDVDCQLSNDAGRHWYPVSYNEDFVFPVKGSNLRYRCVLDSGTRLDDPVIKQLTVDYSTAARNANLISDKGIDANGDGNFTDKGAPVKPGDVLTYQVKVVNNGTDTAKNVVVKDDIPAGTEYVPGSTTLDGQAVPDQAGGAPFLAPAGLNIGDLPGQNLVQVSWDHGGGQGLFGDLAKFDAGQNVDYSQKEVLGAMDNYVRQDANFGIPGQSIQISDNSSDAVAALSGAVKLNNGHYFSAWKNSTNNSIVGRFFDAQGTPLTGELNISDSFAGTLLPPVARQIKGGPIVVAWTKVGANLSEIVMKKLDIVGNILDSNDIVLTSQSSNDGSVTISLDRLKKYSNEPHNSMVVDPAGNIYLGWVHVTSDCTQQAEVAKFDQSGNSLFGPPTNPGVVVSGAACDVIQAPVLSLNNSGEIMAVHTTSSGIFLNTTSAIVANVIDTAGNILAAPTTINANPLPAYFYGVKYLSALAGHDFLLSYNHKNGSCVGACLQKITYQAGTISFESPYLLDGAGQNPVVAADVNDESIIAIWTHGDQLYVRAFDYNLNTKGDIFIMPLDNLGLGPSYPSLALDATKKLIWVNWEQGFGAWIFGNLLHYGVVPHELVSSVYDAGAKTDWTSIETTTDIPTGSAIKMQVRAGNNAVPDGTWTAFMDVPLDGDWPSGLENYRYVQYKVIFELTDLNARPKLYDVAIGQNGVRHLQFKVRVKAGTNTVISNQAVVISESITGETVSTTTANQVGEPTLEELYGDDRIDTSVVVSQAQFAADQSANCAVIVRADDPIESLTGAPLAAQCGGPILLNPPTHLDSRVLNELKRILTPGEPIYLLGREKALALSIEGELTSKGFNNLLRRGGRNRETTAVKIAEELDLLEPATIRTAFIANGFKFADPVSASPAAATKDPGSTRSPILLIKSTGVEPEVKDFLNNHPDIKTVYIVGGESVAPSRVTGFLSSLASQPTAIRIAGQNRFDTSRKVAEKFFPIPVRIFVTSGFGFPVFDAAGHAGSSVPVDALVAGPLAAKQGAPMLFTKSDLIPGEIKDYLQFNRGTIGQLTLIGGPKAIFPTVRQDLFDLIK